METYDTIIQRKLDKVEEEFLNSPYTKQVKMYQLALQLEYYEALAQIVKFLPELPEEFLYDVEHLK